MKLTRVEISQSANILVSQGFSRVLTADKFTLDADYVRQVVSVGTEKGLLEIPMGLCVMWPDTTPVPSWYGDSPVTAQASTSAPPSADVPCDVCGKIFPSFKALAGHRRHCKAGP